MSAERRVACPRRRCVGMFLHSGKRSKSCAEFRHLTSLRGVLVLACPEAMELTVAEEDAR